MSKWIIDKNKLKQINNNNFCICGTEGEPKYSDGEFASNLHCMYCESTFLSDKNKNAIHPDDVLETQESGLIKYDEDKHKKYLYYLIEMSDRANSYIELYPPTEYGEIYLYAVDNIMIGFLIYDSRNNVKNHLHLFGISVGYRGKGYGTEFIKKWYNKTNKNTLKVASFEDTKPFYENLNITIKYLY